MMWKVQASLRATGRLSVNGSRAGHIAVMIGLLLGSPALSQDSGDDEKPAPLPAPAPVPAADPELDLDKLFKISDKKFLPLATRLASFTNAKWYGKSCNVQFELFETVPVHINDGSSRTDLYKPVLKRRGKVQVLGGGRMWPPLECDANENLKSLSITASPGATRKIRFLIKLQASKLREGRTDLTEVYGSESFELELIEHPVDKTLRLALDPATFRKHQSHLQRNWVEESVKEAAAPGANSEAKAKDGEPAAPPQPAAAAAPTGPESEVTLVRSFKADDQSIMIGFRRKTNALNGKVVNGTIKIDVDSTLSTTIYYDLPDKKGKVARACVGLFQGGYKPLWSR